MRTAIIGAGSIGTAIGAYAALENAVTLADSNSELVKALRDNGATVLHSRSDADFTIPVSACLPEELAGKFGLIFLTTKQTANRHVLPLVAELLGENGMVCTLQNGIPEPSVAQAVGTERAIGGSVLFGATLLESGVTRITTDYDRFRKYAFQIGEIDKARTDRLENAARVLRSLGGVSITDRLMDTKWSKLLVNCTRSGLSAALNCTFGEVADNRKGLVCSLFLAKECIEVCRASGYTMAESAGENPNEYYWENKSQLKRSMEIFKSDGAPSKYLKASMLQDLENKRPTEIDYINGFVVAAGLSHSIPTPFNARVVELVKEAESRQCLNDVAALSRFDDLLRGQEVLSELAVETEDSNEHLVAP